MIASLVPVSGLSGILATRFQLQSSVGLARKGRAETVNGVSSEFTCPGGFTSRFGESANRFRGSSRSSAMLVDLAKKKTPSSQRESHCSGETQRVRFAAGHGSIRAKFFSAVRVGWCNLYQDAPVCVWPKNASGRQVCVAKPARQPSARWHASATGMACRAAQGGIAISKKSIRIRSSTFGIAP